MRGPAAYIGKNYSHQVLLRSCFIFLLSFILSAALSQEKQPNTPAIADVCKKIIQLQQDIVKLTIRNKTNYPDTGQDITAKQVYTAINSLDSFVQASQSQAGINSQGALLRLQSCAHLLQETLYALKARALTAWQLAPLLESYYHALDLIAGGNSIFPLIEKKELSVATILLRSLLDQNIQDADSIKTWLLKETFRKNPSNFFSLLFDYPEQACADSLVTVAAATLPEDLYTYSQAKNSELGKKIQNNPDSLVKLICTISSLPGGRQYFPFLDDLYHKKITVTTIKKVIALNKPIPYYQLLVKTQIGYAERLNRKDTAIAYEAVLDKINNSALNNFIYPVNGLHEYADGIRLKVLETLSPRELYYLCIAGVNELYTSSFLKIYEKIFAKQYQTESFNFLQSVHFDHFKRFIKMVSTFNTIDDFLSRMTKTQADTIIHTFITGLTGNNNFEDAVDVADSYGSIKNIRLRRFILEEIKTKIPGSDTSYVTGGQPSIYKMLYTIFLSLDTANHIDLTAALKIPPIYRLENNFLKDDSGRIIIQQFFYGDKDGINAFAIFLKAYRKAGWKMTENKYWVKFVSRTKTPVYIYSNMPLDDNTNQDFFAQQKLSAYLQALNQSPAVIVHRGHSYHLKETLQQLTMGNKLIFLGSCGGYGNLKQVFDISPLAHVITTKQEGTGTINQPLLNYLTDLLQRGKNLEWPEIWKLLELRFKNNTRFKDYIPPYQNLGAILLMAYYQLQRVNGAH